MAQPVKESNNKTYGIRSFYIDNAGKYHQKYKGGFKTANQAIAWAEAFEADSKTDKGMSTLFELIDYFFKVKSSEDLAPITIADYQYYLDIIKTEFGDILLKNITVPMLQNYINGYKKTSCKCRHIKQTLSALFTLAYKQDILEKNLFEKVIKPKYEKKEICFYDAEQMNTLLKFLKIQQPKYYVFMLLLVSTGLRPNEATILETKDIIEINSGKYLSINKAYSEVHDKSTKVTTKYTKKPKSNAGTRLVPIDDKILEEINSYKANNKIVSKLILCDIEGKQITLNSFEQGLKRAIDKNKLPHITPYGLRHTFGNLNKNLGVDSFTVSKLMGHSDPTITEKNYYHNDQQLNKNAINKVASIIELVKN